MKVAVLISVSGGVEEAIGCISGVYRQADSIAGEGKYSVDIFLNDDSCSETLSEAVVSRFPDVRTVRSEGRQYPNRGLRLAWLEAAKGDYDFYLWTVPSISLSESAFVVLLENSGFLSHEAIIAGTVASADGTLVYGGRSRSGKLIPPDDTIPVPCQTFDGSLVLVPRHAFNALGTVDVEFTQVFGAWDYGVRAGKEGIHRVIAPGILATCDSTPGLPEWRDASLSISERYKALRSPEGRPFRQKFTYDLRRRGLPFAVGSFIMINLRTVFAHKK